MLRYVELKTGNADNGPAWIARVTVSRSGRTVYFGSKALKCAKGGGLSSSNYYDLETGEAYWLSGVKKDGSDRHWAGSGPILIEPSAVAEYLRITGVHELPPHIHVGDDLPRPDPSRFVALENERLER